MQLEQIDLQKSWENCLSIIKDNVGDEHYYSWFSPIQPLSFTDNKLTLQVPSQFFCEFLENNYLDLIVATIHRVFGKEAKVFYRINDFAGETVDCAAGNNGNASKKISLITDKSPNPFIQIYPQDLDPQLNPQYNFDNYFEGTSNILARRAGDTVANSPGKTAFNPMFIFGPSGVGKTHLCNAIGERIRELHPEKRVLYVSAHLFYLQFTDSVRKNTSNDFLNFYQNIDVLIIDDIQELLGKEKTQNTFFHIFNHLHQLSKQIILTSDQAPADMQGMTERLITRLKWGLTAELSRPDLELRKKILKETISNEGIKISEDVFNFIADNVTENVRDLKGILISLLAYATTMNCNIDLPLAKYVVSKAVKLDRPKISITNIQDTVCRYFNLEPNLMQTNSRKREIVQARNITMYLAKKYTDKSFANIGSIVGKKDHATVLYACKSVKDQMETSTEYRRSVEEIETKLKN